MRSPGSLVWINLVASKHRSLRFGLVVATSVRINGAWWPKPQAREGPGLKPLAGGPKPLVEHADQGAHARLSSRIGHVCNNNAVLILHSPGNMASPPTLGGVLDGFSNGEGENPLLFSLAGKGGGLQAPAARPWRPRPQALAPSSRPQALGPKP